MRQHTTEPTLTKNLTPEEWQLIETLRKEEFDGTRARMISVLQFIGQNARSLAGALDHFLFSVLYDTDIFRIDGLPLSYRILYQFRRVLFPAPEVDL